MPPPAVLREIATDTVEASDNWWGCAPGPEAAGLYVGVGRQCREDAVSDAVDSLGCGGKRR
jgi:hypothetical protein